MIHNSPIGETLCRLFLEIKRKETLEALKSQRGVGEAEAEVLPEDDEKTLINSTMVAAAAEAGRGSADLLVSVSEIDTVDDARGSLAVVGAPTLQSTKHKQKKQAHTTHTHRMSRCHPTPSGFALSLSLWVGQRCDQIMAPPLPKTMRRRRAIGVALAVVGLLLGGGLVTSSN
jgi:hypothetical protein